jgi:DNA-binding NarL/FixJ family response regulator
LLGYAATVEKVLLQMSKLRPQIVLIDDSNVCGKLSDLMPKIADRDPKILVVNETQSPAQTIEALALGAHGVIGRKANPELLCRAIRAVASGDFWVERGVTTELVGLLRYPKPETPVESAAEHFNLTRRELQIINALVEAQTNKDIAETFGISEFTVKHHLTNVFDKLGVYNRVELALFAIHHRICTSGVAHASKESIRP